MGQEGMYDGALMGILQNCGKLQPFLDAVFSFLARRTDFYIIMQHERAKMGFAPGVAESMVLHVSFNSSPPPPLASTLSSILPSCSLISLLSLLPWNLLSSFPLKAFKKYEILTRKREAEIMREEETKRIEQMMNPSGAHDELPITLPPDPPTSTTTTEGSQKQAEPKEKLTLKDTPEASEPSSHQKTETTSDGTSDSPPGSSQHQGGKKPNSGKKKKKEKQAAFNLSSDTYNGAVMENYQWSQTITDIDIRVPVPEGTTVKNVRVDVRSDHLKVVLLRPQRRVSCVVVSYGGG